MDTQTPTAPTPERSPEELLAAQLAEYDLQDAAFNAAEGEDALSRPSTDRLGISGDHLTDTHGNSLMRISEQV